MKTSKIIKLKSNFSESSKKRYHDIELENGDKGTIASEKEDTYKEQQELKYELGKLKNNSTDMYRINEAKDNKKGFAPRNPKADFIMKALECANTFGASNKLGVSTKAVLILADEYYDRMNKKYSSSNPTNNG